MQEAVSNRQIAGLRALAALAAELSGRKRADERIQALLETAVRMMDVEQAVLAILEPTGSTLTVRAAIPALTGARFERQSLAWTVAAFGRAEVVPDLASDPRRMGIPAELMLRRTLCAPLNIGGAGRGVLLAGNVDSGTRPTDALDLFLLEALAGFAAGILVQEAEEQRELRFHSRLARLAAHDLDSGGPRELDAVLRNFARRERIDFQEEDPTAPLLAELCLATRASAAALAVAGPDGRFRIERSWKLPPEISAEWSEPVETSRRLHEGRMSVAVAGTDSGFPGAALDLRVRVPGANGERVLHVLSPRERAAFNREDARCAELAAVQLAAMVDRMAKPAGLDEPAADAPAELPLLDLDALRPLEG